MAIMAHDSRAEQEEQRLLAYDRRRREVLYAFDRELPYGSRIDAAYDLRISPSSVSGVLTGRMKNERVLAKLEAWLKKRAQAGDAGRSFGTSDDQPAV